MRVSLDGILLIDKPAGLGSAEVVRRIKARVKPVKVGHLGTLDPFATGLLPIMIGEATKLAPFLQGDKEYVGLIKLGAETDTLDCSGQIVRTALIPDLTEDALTEVTSRFTGKLSQTPPIFSAIKRDGVPLYKLARRGVEVAAPPRQVEIKELRLERVESDASALRFRVVCSPGTYIRALARDIGNYLSSAAYLQELRRTRSGGFAIDSAAALDECLAALERGSAALIGLRQALQELPEVDAGPLEARVRDGDSHALDGLVPAEDGLFKVISSGELLAIAQATSPTTAVIVRGFNLRSARA